MPVLPSPPGGWGRGQYRPLTAKKGVGCMIGITGRFRPSRTLEIWPAEPFNNRSLCSADVPRKEIKTSGHAGNISPRQRTIIW